MSVIVSGRQISDNCNVRSCDFCNMDEEERAYCINGEEVTEYADICKKHSACPLKSVDGLIAEIYDKFMTVDGGLHDKTAKKCIEIIREYCGEGKV